MIVEEQIKSPMYVICSCEPTVKFHHDLVFIMLQIWNSNTPSLCSVRIMKFATFLIAL